MPRDTSTSPSRATAGEEEEEQALQTPPADLEAEQPVAQAAPRRGPPAPAAAPPPPLPVLALAAGAAAVAAAVCLLVRHLRRRRGGRVQRAAVGKQQVFSAVLALREPSVPLPPPTPASLAGRTLVLSDRLDVQSLETAFGCQPWKSEQRAASQTYGPADALVAAGAQGIAVVHGEPLGLG